MALSSIGKALRRGAAALFLLSTAAVAAEDGGANLTPQEMTQTAARAIAAGDNALAAQIAAALLQRDPQDVAALIVQSRAQRNLGEVDAARASAKAAWEAAETDAHRFAAAMVRAQALATSGNHTASQLWLRRAVQHSPDDEARAIATRDFRYVRARNPWAAQLSFNIAPTNNINNGSNRDTIPVYIFGIPAEARLSGSARALEGVEYSGGVAGRYRFAQSQTHAHDILFRTNYRTFSMTESAKAQAPGVSGSDFAFGEAAVGYAYHLTPAQWIGPFSLDGVVGRTWYGGQPYMDYARIGGTQQVVLSEKSALSFRTSGERQFNQGGGTADLLRADLRFSQVVGTLGTLGLSVGGTTSSSANSNDDFTEWRGGLDFTLAKPILGTQVNLALQRRERDYERFFLTLNGRSDLEYSAQVNFTFQQVDYYGFSPTLTIHASETDSSIGRFDSDRLGLQLGIRSSF